MNSNGLDINEIYFETKLESIPALKIELNNLFFGNISLIFFSADNLVHLLSLSFDLFKEE